MISVIIPTYNRASFLREAMASVLAQDVLRRPHSPADIEVLVVDDGSADATREVALSFGAIVRYQRLPHRGVSAARNVGLRLARGEYIAFLDSDDLWQKEKLAVQLSFLRAFPEAMVCYTDEIWMKNGLRLNPQLKHQKFSGWIFDKVLPLCLLSLSSCLFRRRVFEEVGDFDESFPVCEDYEFGIRLAWRYPIHLIRRALIIKRGGHPDQLSRQYWGMDRFRVKALEKALTLPLEPWQRRLVEAEIVRKCIILVKGFEKRQNWVEAERYRAKIQRYSPSAVYPFF